MRVVRVEALLCFLNNDRLKLEVLSLSGRLFHKYGNLLKKVPLNNSVLTLIFNLLLLTAEFKALTKGCQKASAQGNTEGDRHVRNITNR